MNTKMPVIAIFDIGKTNKKLLVFNEQYSVVKEASVQFDEIVDDDGFPCEDVDLLTKWMIDQLTQLKSQSAYLLKAVNFTTYGASLVYINEYGERIGYLYNYLKPYPKPLWNRFVEMGTLDSVKLSVETSSPLMGHLNAGMQLFWLKNEKPHLYKQVVNVLHFPQYLSYLLTGLKVAELTSVGCHSVMWHFEDACYHYWLKDEEIAQKLSPITSGSNVTLIKDNKDSTSLLVGTGLHDSSAAIIPYLKSFAEPFLVISTGTWSISLNPFNQSLSKKEDLEKGVLNYLTYRGAPMKVSMLFAGNDHDLQVKRISSRFNMSDSFYKSLDYNASVHQILLEKNKATSITQSVSDISGATDSCAFHLRGLEVFISAEEAYYQLIEDLIAQQARSTGLVLSSTDVQQIFVDGGFSKNKIYMNILSQAFPEKKVAATSMKEGTALGAALAIHSHWNSQPIPTSLISLEYY